MNISTNKPYTPPSATELQELALHSISVFTTLTVQNKKALGLALHLNRLGKDTQWMNGSRIEKNALKQMVCSYLDIHNLDHAVIRITVFPKHFSITEPEKNTGLNILITHRPAPKKSKISPISLHTQNTFRPFAQHKSGNLMVGMTARKNAKNNGYDDALFIHNNTILEGPTWNILFQKGTQYITPPSTSPFLLPGVTLQLIKKSIPNGYDWEEREISLHELHTFDHAFITSSVVGGVPIRKIDDIDFQIPEKSVLTEALYNTEWESLY